MTRAKWSSLWVLVCVALVGCGDCRSSGEATADAHGASSSEMSGDGAASSAAGSGSENEASTEDATPELVESNERPASPERIVALAPNVTEILYALDLDQQIVAVSQHSDHPPAARDKPSVGNFQNPDFESLIARDPDIVVGTTSGGDKSVATRLDEADIAYLFVRMATIEETLEGIRTIGRAVGRQAAADELADQMAADMNAITEETPDGASPRVLMVYGREPVVAAGPKTFGHQLIERAGGTNVLEEAGSKYPRVDLEKILQLDPDVILDASGMGRDAGGGAFWEQFDALSAVQQGRVVYLTQTAVMRPGPRLPTGLEYIADAIHE